MYLSGLPRIPYYAFQNLPFIAPNAKGIDVPKPWDGTTPRPNLNGRTVFAFLPERTAELETVKQWFPNGETIEFRYPDFVYPQQQKPLFTVYDVKVL